MIRAVRANQKGFHTTLLQPGVNLILADRSKSAGDKDTTNALGKLDLPWKSGEPISRRQVAASNRIGLL
ncbi:hypothetical protein SAMN05880556_11891 [Azospirillum sp. RU38E]|jgi:hypothetical protein|nr:hypothetical protein SAMN05880556_11891 [Azospirillum sp. RU38E]SNT16832.1 hypothetical protein SAMN05880591_11891 [Azospirillum sp. RU37A]